VSDQIPAWLHCSKCGEVFQSTTDAVLCTSCERAPIPNKKKANVHIVDGSGQSIRKEFSANLTPVKAAERSQKRRRINQPEEPAKQPSDQPTRPKHSSNHSERRSKSAQNFTLIKLIALWFVALIGISLFIKYRLDSLRPPVSIISDDNPLEDAALLSKNIDVANQSYAPIMATANEFFQTTAPESYAQLCRKRPRLAQTIFNDASKATLFKPDTAPELISRNVIRIGEKPMIETIWADERKRQVEIVFGPQDDQWLVDWESFAKTSSMPWSVFHAEKEDGEGTFRMLVRQRLAKENTSDLIMSVMFYEPGFFHGSNLGLPTPPFTVERKSRDGKLILAALKARENNEPIFGSMFPASDPPSTARVTVKIRRAVKDDVKTFELVEVLACHWLGIDDVGIDLTDTP
jgi:hypothetical protein